MGSMHIDLLILTAMHEEADAFTPHLHQVQEVECPLAAGSAATTVTARTGLLTTANGQQVRCAQVTTGIGTAPAATAATWAILTFAPRIVISAGSCGGLASDINVGDVVIGETYSYSLADATAAGYAHGQLPGAPAVFEGHASASAVADAVADTGAAVRCGLMLSGDAFVTADKAEPMRELHPSALSADMESTALAHTAERFGLPFLAVRGVSDLCSPRADEEFSIGLDAAAEASAAAVLTGADLLV